MPQLAAERREADALEAIAAMRKLTPGEFARYMDLATASDNRRKDMERFPHWAEYTDRRKLERELARRTPR